VKTIDLSIEEATRSLLEYAYSIFLYLLERSFSIAPSISKTNPDILAFHYLIIYRQRAQKWDKMTLNEKQEYLATTKDEGNKR
jgi:hypothetical protein